MIVHRYLFIIANRTLSTDKSIEHKTHNKTKY